MEDDVAPCPTKLWFEKLSRQRVDDDEVCCFVRFDSNNETNFQRQDEGIPGNEDSEEEVILVYLLI